MTVYFALLNAAQKAMHFTLAKLPCPSKNFAFYETTTVTRNDQPEELQKLN